MRRRTSKIIGQMSTYKPHFHTGGMKGGEEGEISPPPPTSQLDQESNTYGNYFREHYEPHYYKKKTPKSFALSCDRR